jgi:glycosyltransferase involved in cell wall biosynthesis
MISVVIPTYNRKTLVREAIDSVLIQTDVLFEIIVVDDASTDGTEEALEDYISTGRIRYIKRVLSGGAAAARNDGIRIALGEYVCFLDSDDMLIPGSLGKRQAVMDADSSLGLVCSNWYAFSDDNLPIILEPSWLSRERYIEHINNMFVQTREHHIVIFNSLFAFEAITINFFNTSTVFVRRSVLDQVGFFDESLVIAEDRDLWSRIITTRPTAFIDEPLSATRRHGSSLVAKDLARNFHYDSIVIDRFLAKNEIIPQIVRPFLFARLRVFYSTFGCYLFWVGSYDLSRLFLRKSIKYGPPTLKIFVLIFASLLPAPLLSKLVAYRRKILNPL